MTWRLIEERAKHYGPVGPNIRRIARLWSAYLGVEVTPHDVGWLMVLLKASRSKVDPEHGDNYEDATAYIRIAQTMSGTEGLDDLPGVRTGGDAQRGGAAGEGEGST